MSLPLAAGHVLVRIGDGDQRSADAVLDALEGAFPTHTGRGHARIGNAWEDPPTVTPQGTRSVAGPAADGASTVPSAPPGMSSSQAFDVRTAAQRRRPVPLPGEATADVLGLVADVGALTHTLGELFRVQESGRDEQGPNLSLRLRIGPRRPPRAPNG
ncbi:hypothetical protein LN042_01385 [Kitasatospora sp. RB6PN24]|uniref:hypothetical protein n=1 Tax=Kitasatospora humi TaxID=2893891 RepID=UPI001E63FA65|nr:hypothetical protein [Kitasatospora humi]MCC9305772.1 hypothetical protein [Kitasatospora humi]